MAAGSDSVLADLHMHSEHSWDCTTPIDELLDAALAAGLGALAVTDHNTIAGGLEARARAVERGLPLHVIVGSEIKTAADGEVIGLFLHEEVPRGLTFAETLERIHAQGGVVYVPHPVRPLPHDARARACWSEHAAAIDVRRDRQRAPLARARQPRGRALRAASTACGAGPAPTPTCPPASARARCDWPRSTIPARSCAPSTTPRSCAGRAACCGCRSRSDAASARNDPGPRRGPQGSAGSGRTPERCPPTSSTSVTWRVRSARSTHLAMRSPAAATRPRASLCSAPGTRSATSSCSSTTPRPPS